jgi:hypothetical protein
VKTGGEQLAYSLTLKMEAMFIRNVCGLSTDYMLFMTTAV